MFLELNSDIVEQLTDNPSRRYRLCVLLTYYKHRMVNDSSAMFAANRFSNDAIWLDISISTVEQNHIVAIFVARATSDTQI